MAWLSLPIFCGLSLVTRCLEGLLACCPFQSCATSGLEANFTTQTKTSQESGSGFYPTQVCSVTLSDTERSPFVRSDPCIWAMPFLGGTYLLMNHQVQIELVLQESVKIGPAKKCCRVPV